MIKFQIFSLPTQELENKVEELSEENCDLKMANEKLEDELKEKKRAAEGMELVSMICAGYTNSFYVYT